MAAVTEFFLSPLKLRQIINELAGGEREGFLIINALPDYFSIVQSIWTFSLVINASLRTVL
jgi:hypothetical protein